jgi:hypoxanthine phosphoribosyltransferase
LPLESVAVLKEAVPLVVTVAEVKPLTTPDRVNAEVVLVLVVVVVPDDVVDTGVTAEVAAVLEEELEPPPHALNVTHAQ